jgi:hypothetical protein
MAVSSIGNGLTVVIECDFLPHHEWMSFLAYWSLKNNLPEAKAIVTCVRRDMNIDILNWPRKCNVPILFHKPMDQDNLSYFIATHPKIKVTQDFIFIKPTIVFLRDFEESSTNPDVFERGKNISEIQGIVSKINSENPTICCDYSEGWGKFVTSDWINKKSIPFSSVNFVDADMSLNENRLARLWKSATKIYPSVSRG